MPRITVNDEEKAYVKLARQLMQARAKRRSIEVELQACDDVIDKLFAEMQRLTQPDLPLSMPKA